MLDHRAAIFGAVPTGLSAGSHVLVVRGLLAPRGAIVAALRASFQHVAGEWALASAQSRTHLAALGAIDT